MKKDIINNCIVIVNTQIIDYLDDNFFQSDKNESYKLHYQRIDLKKELMLIKVKTTKNVYATIGVLIMGLYF